MHSMPAFTSGHSRVKKGRKTLKTFNLKLRKLGAFFACHDFVPMEVFRACDGRKYFSFTIVSHLRDSQNNSKIDNSINFDHCEIIS